MTIDRSVGNSSSLITLTGCLTLLEALDERHIPSLMRIAQATPELFALTNTPVSVSERDSYFSHAFRERDLGKALPFAIIRLADGTVVGTTRFGEIDYHNKRCAIGHTWLAPSCHGSGINSDAKYVMLVHAFDEMSLNRVQFQTDARNIVSRRALEKLGAGFEGILREHRQTKLGETADTAIYSIVASEWPQLKAALEARVRLKAGI